MPARAEITGLVLAGGAGRRMGGVDKGLVELDGQPLVAHALARLRPQVGALVLSANRHLDVYRGHGVPVITDDVGLDGDALHHAGPLAGLAAALRAGPGGWIASVPCDTPRFPADLVARLAAACDTERADVAVACTPTAGGNGWRREPVFCLVPRSLAADLDAWLAGGGRKVDDWLARHRVAEVRFDDRNAFANANTREELDRLRTH